MSVILNEKKQVLLLLRNDMPVWEVIGGRAEEGEIHEEAAMREALEEIGIPIRIDRVLGNVYHEFKPDAYVHFRVFSSHLTEGDIYTDEHVTHAWFDRESIPLNIHPLHRMMISHAVNNMPTVEYATSAGVNVDDLTLFPQLELSDMHYFKEWNVHPKVIAKRAKGEMRFDPVAQQ